MSSSRNGLRAWWSRNHYTILTYAALFGTIALLGWGMR